MVLRHQTIYFSLPVQALIIHTIKKPILESAETIFDKKASKIDKLKALSTLWSAVKAVSCLLKPTLENTWHPNSHNLIKLRDWLLGHLDLEGIGRRQSFIERLFNLAIIIYDFDPPWRWIMDGAKDEALKMEWKPQGWGDDWSEGYEWWKELE